MLDPSIISQLYIHIPREYINYGNSSISLLWEFSNTFRRQGTVSVISSDPPFKECHARVTAVYFKALSDEVCLMYQCL